MIEDKRMYDGGDDIDYGAVSQMWVDPSSGAVLDAGSALAVVEATLSAHPDTPLRDMALALVAASRVAMREITRAEDAKVHHDKLGDMEMLLKRRGAKLTEANLISAERLRVEQETGQMLAGTVSAGNPRMTGGRTLPSNINRNQSSQWQMLAKIPAPLFEEWLQEQIGAEQEITTGGALNFYWRMFKQDPQAPETEASNDGGAAAPDTTDYSEAVRFRCPHCGREMNKSELITVYNAPIIDGVDDWDMEERDE